MRIQRIILVLLAFLAFTQANAQHYSELHPQTAESARKYKKSKVRLEQVFMRIAERDTFFSIKFVDTSGYIMVSQKKKEKVYLTYDNQHRLIRKMDTVYYKKMNVTNDANYIYDSRSRLASIYDDKSISKVMYEKDSRDAMEKVLYKDNTVILNFFRYNEKGLLKEEEFRDAKNKPKLIKKYLYDDNGRLERLTETEYIPNGTRSITATIFQNNAKGQVTNKQVTIVTNYEGDEPDPDVKRNPIYATQNYTYEYDAAGNPVKEVFTDSRTENLHYKIYRKFDKDGLTTEEDVRDGHERPQYKLIYEYDLWENKK